MSSQKDRAIAVTHPRASAPVQTKKRDSRAKQQPPTIRLDSTECLAHAFSNFELLVAADVIKSAISEGRKHVDLEALRRVLAKLAAAYESKKRRGH
jgi:hypothetical protein